MKNNRAGLILGGQQMYAVIEVGAKQYNVKSGDIIDVEKQRAHEGQELNLDRVLLVSKDKKIEIGKPYLKDAKVSAVVLKQLKTKKVISFKYRRRKSSHWKKGHRQSLTRLKIKDIEIG
jgi:large subunit ribosomal protein L21